MYNPKWRKTMKKELDSLLVRNKLDTQKLANETGLTWTTVEGTYTPENKYEKALEIAQNPPTTEQLYIDNIVQMLAFLVGPDSNIPPASKTMLKNMGWTFGVVKEWYLRETKE